MTADTGPPPAAAARTTVGAVAGLSAGVVLALLWLGPLPEMARLAFSPHMILHLGLVGIAAPLLAAAILCRRRPSAGIRVPASLAIGAAATEMLVVWGWHAPLLHAAAARSDGFFVLQQASFLAASTIVWVVSFAGRSPAAIALGVLVMGSTFAHMTMLGIGFVLATGVIYPPDICRGAFGFDPLTDQQFGGTLMAVFGGLPYLAGMSVLLARLLSPRE